MRPEAVGRRSECPEPGRWAAPDGYASEVETSRFLGDLVAFIKPDLVVETGAYHGHTSAAIGQALVALGRGRLEALEVDPDRASLARARCEGLPVTVHAADSTVWEPPGPIDLLFLDSEFETRVPECRRFVAWASPRCVIAVHDTGNRAYPAASRMVELLEALAGQGLTTPWVYLPTPRGLGLARYRQPGAPA